MRLISSWQIFLIPIFLVGCTAGTHYGAPEMDVPCEWHRSAQEGMNEESPDCFVWWSALNDPILNSLLQKASMQNLDLQIASNRILQARLERKGKTAELYPHIDASANYGHVYYNADTLNDILCRKDKHCGHRHLNFFELGFDAEWELDLFGAKRYEINAAQARMEASEENFFVVWVTLSAEIGKNYIELRGFQQSLELLKRNIEAQKDIVDLTQGLVQAGMRSAIELRQSEELLNSLNAQKPLIELSIERTIHRLSILIGYNPRDLYTELIEPSPLPNLPCDKPIGVPSELLRRRPDIRKAEREFAAASEEIGSAVASLFPRLSLRGFLGDISTHSSSLLSSSSFTWFAGPQLLLPIFNSRLLKQNVDYTKLKTREACFQYQKTVLAALEETENAIASFHYELEHNQHLAAALESNQAAYELSLELYQKGVHSYLQVQEANRALIASQEAYRRSQVDLILHFIALYKALGGGWDITQASSDNRCD